MTLAKILAPVVMIAGVAGSALAAPVSPINVARDRDSVVITVAGVAPSGAPVVGDDYIDVPIAAGARIESYVRLDDATVRKVELGDASEPRVRVKLRTGRRQTQAIAAGMIVNPSERGAVIIVPRNPTPAATTPEPAKAEAKAEAKPAAKPEIKPEPEKAAAPIAPPPGSLPAALKEVAPEGAPSKPAVETPAAIPAATAEAAAATVAATAQTATTPAPAPAPATVSTTARPIELKPSSNGLPWTSIIILGGLAAAAGLVYMRKNRKLPAGELPPMAVRASMSLGGKARVVLLSADDREMLVAVDNKGVRLLDSWNRTEAALEGEEAPPRRATTQMRAQTASPTAPYGDDFDFDAPRQRTGIGTRPGIDAGVAPSDDFDFEAPRQRTGVGIPRMETGADRSQRLGTLGGADRSSRIDLINRVDRESAPPSDQVSGLLRLRHAARAEDAAAAEPDDDGESPWAQHLMASLRRGGKPS